MLLAIRAKALNPLSHLLKKFYLLESLWQGALEVIVAGIQEAHGREKERFLCATWKRPTAMVFTCIALVPVMQ